MKIFISGSFTVALALFISISAFSQKKTFVGINVNSSFSALQSDAWFGGTVSMQVTERSGFESGLYYRSTRLNIRQDRIDSTMMQTSYAYLSVQHLMLPLLYKYHTKFFDIAAGPYFQYYLGWCRRLKDQPQFPISSFKENPKFTVNWMAKISRDIAVRNQLILEPEIRYTRIQGLGFGIGLKREL